MSENIALTIKRDPEKFGEDSSFFLKPNGMNTTSNTKEYLKYHCFIRKSNYTAMNFEMKPHHLGIHYNVRKNFKFVIMTRKSDSFALISQN